MRRNARFQIWVALFASCALAANIVSCSSDDDATAQGGPHDGGGGTGGTVVIPVGGDAAAANEATGPWQLPSGFTASEFGGYQLGDPVGSGGAPPVGDDGGAGQSGGCGTIVTGVVRDFKGYNDGGTHAGHPDFENWCCGDDHGIVTDVLGADRKPVYAAPGGTTVSTHGQDAFDQWYRSVDGINMPYYIRLALQPSDEAHGIVTFHSTAFFPLDGQGFGNFGRDHNFHFTTELHLQFTYKGGETFTFTGDDDVFVFINGHRAINLGGVHGAENAKIDLDAQAGDLGISAGSVYDLDLFHAERHTTQSNFRIDTTMEFVNCGEILPDPH